MADGSVDYDEIAKTYNRRFEVSKQEGVAAALAGLARDVEATRILEVGCGTGRWLADLGAVTNQLYGLDFSMGMLGQAVERETRLHLTQGKASHLPFPAASFDLVYCVNAIHHFGFPDQFVRQARRLLRPGGSLAVVGMDPHAGPVNWYVYDYFSGTLETDLGRFPSTETVKSWMTAEGFREIQWQSVEHIHDRKLGRAVFDDRFLQKYATSQLTLLTDEAYATGLLRMEAVLADAEARGDDLVFESEIVLGMVAAKVSPETP